VQPLAPAAALLGGRIVLLALHLHTRALRQLFHGLLEVEALGLLNELERVAALAAAEAVVELLVGVHRERGRPLVVERAQPGPSRPDPAEVGLLGDEVHHVHRFPHAVDRVLREQRHAQNPCGTDRCSNSRIAYLSVIPASQSTTAWRSPPSCSMWKSNKARIIRSIRGRSAWARSPRYTCSNMNERRRSIALPTSSPWTMSAASSECRRRSTTSVSMRSDPVEPSSSI